MVGNRAACARQECLAHAWVWPAVCLVCVTAFADVHTVTVVGDAPGASANARDEALHDALRRAVERVAGSVLSDKSDALNFALNYGKVEERRSMVQSQEVVRTWEEGALYRVEVRASVSLEHVVELWGRIKQLPDRVRNPRFMVIVRDGESSRPMQPARDAVEKAMRARGFPAADTGRLASLSAQDRALLAAGSDVRAVSKIAQRLGLELLIVGSASTEAPEEKTLYGVRQYFSRAQCTLRAVAGATGRSMAGETGTARRGARTPEDAHRDAISFAATDAAERLVEHLIRAYARAVAGEPVQVSLVLGECTHADSQQILQLLARCPRVQECRLRAYAGSVATYDLALKPGTDLAGILAGLSLGQAGIPNARVTIESASPRQVKARLTPAKPRPTPRTPVAGEIIIQ